MKILINFANAKFETARKYNSKMGLKYGGFDKVTEYKIEDLDPEFREKYKDILSIKRGGGQWLWKPYIVLDALKKAEDGDIIFYLDSGAYFIKNVDLILKEMGDDWLYVTDIPLIEKNFTKPSCFVNMGCDEDKYKYTNQIQSGYIAIRNCEIARKFFEEWLLYSEDPGCLLSLGDFPPTENVGEEFLTHREDQSVLSLLCKKWGIKQHRDPSQNGFFDADNYSPFYEFRPVHHDDKYGTVVFLHRTGDLNKPLIFKNMIKTVLRQIKFELAGIRKKKDKEWKEKDKERNLV